MSLNDSTDGCWLTPDPLGGDVTNPQSLNRYAYALNNPATLTDPSGLDSCSYEGSGSPPPCSYSAPVSYTLDGVDVPGSIALGALQVGFAATCPGGNCSGVIAQQGANGTTSFSQLTFGPVGNSLSYGVSPSGQLTLFDSINYGFSYQSTGTTSDNGFPDFLLGMIPGRLSPGANGALQAARAASQQLKPTPQSPFLEVPDPRQVPIDALKVDTWMARYIKALGSVLGQILTNTGTNFEVPLPIVSPCVASPVLMNSPMCQPTD